MQAIRVLFPLFLFLLSACATPVAEKGLKFDANSENGLVAMPADPFIMVLNFRAIQLPERKIVGGYFNACTIGFLCGERQIYDLEKVNGKVFKIRPGTYVLQGYVTERYDRVATYMQKTHLCGAMLPFEVKSGVISIVSFPLSSSTSLSELIEQVEALPRVSAPMNVIKSRFILKKAGWIKGKEDQDCNLDDGDVLEVVKAL